ncbi:hypothetical protein BBO99_00006017 [Phytophthora kernoviae]|uniref:Sm domain-containing protein n=2 Tax=Phytophthora kernoviae TaxID=325452 RepID=A0A3R7H6Z7_9STRA|nr:hypothetical protein G195_003334 [Phytophthora kernoviae 00238/432]KAG2529308.1 hypothetical protein JM16_001846 [Phytophthora kernoviae]KAG2530402.1 hypothetical protein JM18_002271 [Phytophthora kernoviae]RLN27080.1 hypothetical protein BBI17_002524 [Phytophthora kernoviae]RLN78359.1 hypothetical protein BBO99_00006017 [Phytophthora kernoviae]
MLGIKTSAVLSLNGEAQVTLVADSDGELTQQQQHADPSTKVGEPTMEIMKLLGALVRLRISDSRVVVGRFHCFDKHQNVILKDAREFAPTRNGLKKSKDKAVMAAEAEARDQEEEARFAGKHIVYMKVQS